MPIVGTVITLRECVAEKITVAIVSERRGRMLKHKCVLGRPFLEVTWCTFW